MRVGVIYKIIVGESNDCYVGSTFQPLKFRFRDHKNHYNQWKEGKSHFVSVYDLFQTFGVENCRMIQVREYEVCDRRHLAVYETLWIKKLKAKNKTEPCGGLLHRQKMKQYREENKERLKEQKKQYYEVNRERVKQYKIENKEKIAEQQKKYNEKKKEFYLKNREHIRKSQNQKASEQIQCEICGITIRRSSMKDHIKSKKHQSKLCLE